MNMPLAFSSAAPPLRIAALRYLVGDGRTLEVDHLDVAPGEILAIAGLNGAGKSTLLRCILDLCPLQSGSIELFGVSHRNPAARARSAFLSEKFMPSYYLGSRDLLRFALALHGGHYVEAEARNMCSELELDPGTLDRPARTLSKGMMQKLGLAACFLSRKPLLLLDEPASGLDAHGRAALAARMRAHRERGHAIVFSSHHLSDVASLADRTCVLHRGLPLHIGTAEHLVARYGGDNAEQAILRCIESAERAERRS